MNTRIKPFGARLPAHLLLLAAAAAVTAAFLIRGPLPGTAASLPRHVPANDSASDASTPAACGRITAAAFHDRRPLLRPEVGDRFVYRFVRKDDLRLKTDRDGLLFRAVDDRSLDSVTTTEGELVATALATESGEDRWRLEVASAAVLFSDTRNLRSAPIPGSYAIVKIRSGAVAAIGLPSDAAPETANLLRWTAASLFQWRIEEAATDPPAEFALADESGAFFATFSAGRDATGAVAELQRRKLRYAGARGDDSADGGDIRVVRATADAVLGEGWIASIDESQSLVWSGPDVTVEADSTATFRLAAFGSSTADAGAEAGLHWSAVDRRDRITRAADASVTAAPRDALRDALAKLRALGENGLHSADAVALLFELSAAAAQSPEAAADLQRAILSGELGSVAAAAIGALADAARSSDSAATLLAELLTDARSDPALRQTVLMSAHELGPRSTALVDAVCSLSDDAGRSDLGDLALLTAGSMAAEVEDEAARARLRAAVDNAERRGASAEVVLAALENEGDPSRIAAAAERYVGHPDPAVRKALAELLGDVDVPKARRALERLADAPEPEVRTAARLALDRQSEKR